VTDSAASATAWTTGVKTYNGALGVDIHEKDHATILEMAKAAGLATGNVSTAELQDATLPRWLRMSRRVNAMARASRLKMPDERAGKRR
jgi:hypothetical protein